MTPLYFRLPCTLNDIQNIIARTLSYEAYQKKCVKYDILQIVTSHIRKTLVML